MIRLALAILCAAVSLAAAAPRFEILDRGDAVEIIAFDTTALSTEIRPVRSRLEVPVAPGAALPKLVPGDDKTVKVVEVGGRSQRVLSVKLALDRPDVRALAKHAQAIQVGKDLHLIVPRALPAEGQPIVLPEPTLPPALAEKAAAIAPIPTIAPATDAPDAASTPTETSQAAATTEPRAPAAGPSKAAPVAKAPAPSPRDKTPILLALTLAALGGAVWLKRRNAAPKEPVSSIEIVAQRSLGPKAKVVWLRAGERELIVSVSPQTVRTLGHWKTGDAAPDGRRAPLPEAVMQSVAPEASSPAVAGILRLRARTNAPPVVEAPVDDPDADSAWAKELLAATVGNRR